MTAVEGNRRAGGLDRLATDSGQFAILALDHVRSFATTLRPDDPDSITADEMHGMKDRLIDGLTPDASAILIDPELAASRFRSSRPLAPGLIVGIEDGDYATAAESPRLRPGWSVARVADLGADAVKISFSFKPEDTTAAERFVHDVVRACELVNLPLFCEPIVQTGGGDDLRRGVLEGLRRFGGLGPDVLKIQFPCDTVANPSRGAWVDACGEVDDLSPVPWALLSEGRGFDEFRELLTIACQAGASGFVAGRAIWGLGATEPDTIPASSARLATLRSLAVNEGWPWRSRRRDSPASTDPLLDSERVGETKSEEVPGPFA
jgi:tagatose-1,6-bisphosphate aldolase